MLKETIIALALQSCHWVPAEIPQLAIVQDVAFDEVARRFGYEHKWGLTLWLKDGTILTMLRSTGADDERLCHEWRHVVEGQWHD